MRYALVKNDNTIDRLSDSVDPNVLTKTGYKWLRCDKVAQPAYDSNVEKITGPSYTVNVDNVTEVWGKTALTDQEISDLKYARLSAIDALQFRIMFDLQNRLRVLEGKTAVTASQFRNALKELL